MFEIASGGKYDLLICVYNHRVRCHAAILQLQADMRVR